MQKIRYNYSVTGNFFMLAKQMRLIHLIKSNNELLFWGFALIALYFLDPTNSHWSLCPLNNLNIGFCPGCGLGHSIHYALHLNLTQSISAHPLGIAAIIIISHRIYRLFILNTRNWMTLMKKPLDFSKAARSRNSLTAGLR